VNLYNASTPKKAANAMHTPHRGLLPCRGGGAYDPDDPKDF